MNDSLIFPIVIHPEVTKLDKFWLLLLVSSIFIPFIYGLVTSDIIYCLSLVIGIFGIIVFNSLTDSKFTVSTMVQKNKLVRFSIEELKILDNENTTVLHWNELENIEINLIAYKNKFQRKGVYYAGIENYILFTFNEVNYEYLFYIGNQDEFNRLSIFFENIILPKLYGGKRIKNENIIITKLEYDELGRFKAKYDINRHTDFIHFN